MPRGTTKGEAKAAADKSMKRKSGKGVAGKQTAEPKRRRLAVAATTTTTTTTTPPTKVSGNTLVVNNSRPLSRGSPKSPRPVKKEDDEESAEDDENEEEEEEVVEVVTSEFNEKPGSSATTTTKGKPSPSSTSKSTSTPSASAAAAATTTPTTTKTASAAAAPAARAAPVSADDDGYDYGTDVKDETGSDEESGGEGGGEGPEDVEPGSEAEAEEDSEEEGDNDGKAIKKESEAESNVSEKSSTKSASVAVSSTSTSAAAFPGQGNDDFDYSTTVSQVMKPKIPRTFAQKESSRRLYVVLERACLESVKVGRQYQLLNSDDHIALLKKKGREFSDARPDILHSCLLMLMDSPLNKAGLLQVYIHAENNTLIEVSPHTRIPRTFKRFAGLMVQLLFHMSVRATDGPDKLLTLIKNPVTQYFPINCKKIGTSVRAKHLVQIDKFVREFITEPHAVFVIGAMPHGSVQTDYVDTEISFSEYPLSGAIACAKVTSAFEKLWDPQGKKQRGERGKEAAGGQREEVAAAEEEVGPTKNGDEHCTRYDGVAAGRGPVGVERLAGDIGAGAAAVNAATNKPAVLPFGAQCDLRVAVKLPEREDLNEWIAVNTVDFFNQINLIYGSIADFCTKANCPIMSAGPNYEYLWADEQLRKPIQVSAPDYVDNLMAWVQHFLNDENVFPSSSETPFPKNFMTIIKQIFKRLFRVYAHMYYNHYRQIQVMGDEPHLNTCFQHFYYFVHEFSLVEPSDMAPLAIVIEQLTGDRLGP
ncbi:mob1/phocein family protein [Pelomyxa schiedti]|nr:mob1/phocein family protein [Pelomyxa schiedti]